MKIFLFSFFILFRTYNSNGQSYVCCDAKTDSLILSRDIMDSYDSLGNVFIKRPHRFIPVSLWVHDNVTKKLSWVKAYEVKYLYNTAENYKHGEIYNEPPKDYWGDYKGYWGERVSYVNYVHDPLPTNLEIIKVKPD